MRVSHRQLLNTKHPNLERGWGVFYRGVGIVLSIKFSLIKIGSYVEIKDLLDLKSSILHLRKALEIFALASIAPNKIKYQEYRAQADGNPDYTKDYKASSILKALSGINSDFYPIPLLPAEKLENGTWHFNRKTGKFFDKNQFIKLYDRYTEGKRPAYVVFLLLGFTLFSYKNGTKCRQYQHFWS